MKFAFLPNYFKKIGIIGFCLFFAVSVGAGFLAVYQVADSVLQTTDITSSYQLGLEIGRNFVDDNYWVFQVSSILLLLSIASYMLAKEKVDDEYMDAIRWESLRLSFIISIGITILAALIHWVPAAKSILLVQFIAYLITFKIKKSSSIENE